MKKNLILFALVLVPILCFARGQLQDSNFKTSAELAAQGQTDAQLLNDTKIYVTANGLNKKLSAAITNGDLGGGGSSFIARTPTIQKFTSGSGTYGLDYIFTITSGSATVGATYTNNSVTFTIYATVSSSTIVIMHGTGAPATSGTLAKASGTGDSTLTFSKFQKPLYLKVVLSGGGGGGGGAGTGNTIGGTGGSTTFGSSLLTAAGGAGGDNGANTAIGGTGGAVTVNSPAVDCGSIVGGRGTGAGGAGAQGSAGGNNSFGGAGGGGFAGFQGGQDAASNTGAGGGGSGGNGSTIVGGGSGGAGGYICAIIDSPSNSYSYAVGASGSAGTAASKNGGSGGSGVVIVEEYFQ